MTAYTAGVIFQHTDNSTFQVWGKGISDALTAIGLVKTSDTGQIDWTSVTRPGTSTDAGYEIWRFNDSAQTAFPIYLKLRYGTGGSAALGRLQIDVGSGSDGSGTLTGTTQSNVINLTFNGNSTSSYPIYASYAYGALTFFHRGAASVGWRFVIERFRDSDGTLTSGAFFFGLYSSSISGNTFYTFKDTGTWDTSITGGPIWIGWPIVGYARSVGHKGTVYAAGALVPHVGSDHEIGVFEKTLGMMTVSSVDFAPGDKYKIVRWDGIEHTYVVLDSVYCEISYTTSGGRPALLWE